MPHDVTTWTPRRLILPTFASQYVPDDLTTVEKFVKEYLHGTRGRPPLKQIEEYYGPGKKRGNLPTWRSQSTRGAGIRKYDQQMCRRKKLYDQIDAGVTADGFYDVVRRENNELFSDPKYQRDGTILRWLIQYYTRKGSRYEENRRRAIERNKKRKENRMIHQNHQNEDNNELDDESDEPPLEIMEDV